MSTAQVNGHAGSSTDGAASKVQPSEVGWQFVPQYYNFVNKQPHRLHCFYTKQSTFTHGEEGEEISAAFGQQEIHDRITAIGYNQCKVYIHSIDSQSSANGGIIILVIGEMSNNCQPWRKFTQTFFLAEQPNGYFVLNDIFRYLKEEVDDEEEVESSAGAAASVQQTPAQSAPAPAPAAAVPTEEAVSSVETPAAEEPTEPEPVNEPAHPDPAVVPEEAVIAAVPDQDVAPSEAPVVEETPVAEAPAPAATEASPAPSAAAVPAKAEAPAASSSSSSTQAPIQANGIAAPSIAPPSQAPAPAKPSAPKSWASMAAAASGKPAWGAPAPAVTAPPAVVQKKEEIAPTPQPAAPAASSAPAPATNQPRHPYYENAMRVQTPHCFVKLPNWSVENQSGGETLDENTLKTAASRFGEVAKVEIVKQKACAFVEFKTVDSARKAIVASLAPNQGGEGGVKVGSEGGKLNFETRKEKDERRQKGPGGPGGPGPNAGGQRGGGAGGRGGRVGGPGRDDFQAVGNQANGEQRGAAGPNRGRGRGRGGAGAPQGDRPAQQK